MSTKQSAVVKYGVTGWMALVVGLCGLASADTPVFDPHDERRWGCMGGKVKCPGFNQTFVFRKKDVCYASQNAPNHPVPCSSSYGGTKRGFVLSFATCSEQNLGFRQDTQQGFVSIWCGNQSIGRVSTMSLVAQDFYPEKSTNMDGSEHWYSGFFEGNFQGLCQPIN